MFLLKLGYFDKIKFYYTVQLWCPWRVQPGECTVTLRWQCSDTSRPILSFIFLFISGDLDGLCFNLLFLIKHIAFSILIRELPQTFFQIKLLTLGISLELSLFLWISSHSGNIP